MPCSLGIPETWPNVQGQGGHNKWETHQDSRGKHWERGIFVFYL